MRLKNATLHSGRYSLVTLGKMILGEVMRETGKPPRQIAKLLHCKLAPVKRAFDQDPIPHDGGSDALFLTFADIEGKTPRSARLDIENRIVRGLVLSFGGERCNRLIARLLGVGEWRIRRIRKRAQLPSARQLRAARLTKLGEK